MIPDDDESEQIDALPPMSDEDRADLGFSGRADPSRIDSHRKVVADLAAARKIADRGNVAPSEPDTGA